MFTGLMAPLTAAKFILRNRSLVKYFLAPFLINTLLFTLFIYYALNVLPGMIESILPQYESSLLTIAYYILVTLSVALLLLVSVLSFSILGSIISAPFTDLLTEKVERIVLGSNMKESGFSTQDLVKILWRVWEEIKRIAFAALIFLILLPLNLIPIAGQILYLFLSGTILVLFLGLDFFSHTLDRRDYSFKQKLSFIRERFFQALGVGISVWILLLIPIFNFAVLPLAAVGATLCFCENQKIATLSQ